MAEKKISKQFSKASSHKRLILCYAFKNIFQIYKKFRVMDL